MGVALPPMSVPRASVQASVGKGTPAAWARLAMTGTIVAAKGILSTMAEAKAETHRIMVITNIDIAPRYPADILGQHLQQPGLFQPADADKQPDEEEQRPPVYPLHDVECLLRNGKYQGQQGGNDSRLSLPIARSRHG